MSLISPNFDVKLIFFFPNFGQGPFPKIAGKGPENSQKCKDSVISGMVIVYQ